MVHDSRDRASASQPTPLGIVSGLSRHLDSFRSAVDQLVPSARSIPAFHTGPFQRPQQRRRAAPAGVPSRVVMHGTKFAALIPGDGVAEQVITSGLSSFLSLYNTAIIARLVLTWFPNPPAQIVGPLASITDPYLNLFRGIIPPLGGTIDLSPILAFLVLDVFTNAAAGLPAEVGPDGQMVTSSAMVGGWTPAKGAAAWRQRMAAQRQRQKLLQQRCEDGARL